MMPWYPVQRQRLPERPSTISSRVGLGFSAKNAWTEITKPGVQNPHCSPCSSRNACWTGLNPPSRGAMPSIVVIAAPSACTANIRHDRTATPSTITVHAPHTPCSHPRCVPVSAQSSRRKSASVLRASTYPRCRSPFTVIVTRCSPTRCLQCCRQRALHDVRADRSAVPRRRVDVLGRFEISDGELTDLLQRICPGPGCRAHERRPRCRRAHRRAPHAEQRDRRAPDLVAVELDAARHTDEGEVACTARDLIDRKPAAVAPHREADAREQLVWLECRGPRAGEEVGRGERAHPR